MSSKTKKIAQDADRRGANNGHGMGDVWMMTIPKTEVVILQNPKTGEYLPLRSGERVLTHMYEEAKAVDRVLSPGQTFTFKSIIPEESDEPIECSITCEIRGGMAFPNPDDEAKKARRERKQKEGEWERKLILKGVTASEIAELRKSATNFSMLDQVLMAVEWLEQVFGECPEGTADKYLLSGFLCGAPGHISEENYREVINYLGFEAFPQKGREFTAISYIVKMALQRTNFGRKFTAVVQRADVNGKSESSSNGHDDDVSQEQIDTMAGEQAEHMAGLATDEAEDAELIAAS